MNSSNALPVFCNLCNCIVDSISAGSYTTSPDILPNQVIFDESEVKNNTYEYILSWCPKCESPFLSKRTYFNSIDWSGETGFVGLYPSISKLEDTNIPDSVRNAYAQAEKSFNAGLYEPCVIMCRKALEALCTERGMKKGVLKFKIDNLKTDGIIDDKLWKWADSLRMIGNDAAHDLSANIQKEDARDSIDFLIALLSYVYILTAKFNEFKIRYKEGKDKSA